MLFLQRIRAWLLRKKPPTSINPDIPQDLEDDIGMHSVRIQLPSGNPRATREE